MQLSLDLSRDARRSSILAQLEALLGEQGMEAVWTQARAAGVPDRHHHGIVEVRSTIDSLSVPDAVREDLHGVYEILARAEAEVHGCKVDETHFHEVGEGCAILNTLAICLAFRRLSPDSVVATPVQTGSGKIECAHGLMDIPAPATAAILATGIPTCPDLLEGELCTPTSAAIIKHFVTEFR